MKSLDTIFSSMLTYFLMKLEFWVVQHESLVFFGPFSQKRTTVNFIFMYKLFSFIKTLLEIHLLSY